MSVDRSFARSVQSWLEDDLAAVPDPRPVYDRVFMQLPTTPQRRRWSVSIWRRGGSSTVHRAGSPASLNARRDRSMSSAIRVVAIVSVAILSGGFLLANIPSNGSNGQVGGQQVVASASPSPSSVAPASPEAAGVPAPFQGRILFGPQLRGERATIVDGRTELRGGAWQPAIVEMSDARLAGDITISFDTDTYTGAGGASHTLGAGTWRLENDDGAWQGSYNIVFTDEYQNGSVVTTTLVGEGAYDGMVAVWEQTAGADAWDVRGVIFPAPPPAPPTAP